MWPPSPLVLFGSLLLDYGLADPWGWPHPVRAMGWAIERGKSAILALCRDPFGQRLGGALLTVGLVAASYSLAHGLIDLAASWHPWLGILVQVVLLASCLGGRSLRFAALEVLQPLRAGDLEQARILLGRYVGRDTAHLDEAEICRALVETVAENTPDGATGPLFYGLLGAAPLALAYKAVSTLDSMVGYRRPPYTYLGTAAARLEDALTWIPCRLTVLTLALTQPDPVGFWRRVGQNAVQDPSPNSGWSEAAFAWSLGIRLGGTNIYQGVAKHKPFLGVAARPLSAEVVIESVGLLRRILWIWVGLIGLGYGLVGWLG